MGHDSIFRLTPSEDNCVEVQPTQGKTVPAFANLAKLPTEQSAAMSFKTKPKRHILDVLLLHSGLVFSESASKAVQNAGVQGVRFFPIMINDLPWFGMYIDSVLDTLDYQNSSYLTAGSIITGLRTAVFRQPLPSTPAIFDLVTPNKNCSDNSKYSPLNGRFCNEAARKIFQDLSMKGIEVSEKLHFRA